MHPEGISAVSLRLLPDELDINKSRSVPGNAPRIGIGNREVVCQK